MLSRSALMTAASEGHISIVRLFLQHNANTELKDSQGWKASDHAVIHGHHRLGRHDFFLTQRYHFKVEVLLPYGWWTPLLIERSGFECGSGFGLNPEAYSYLNVFSPKLDTRTCWRLSVQIGKKTCNLHVIQAANIIFFPILFIS